MSSWVQSSLADDCQRLTCASRSFQLRTTLALRQCICSVWQVTQWVSYSSLPACGRLRCLRLALLPLAASGQREQQAGRSGRSGSGFHR